MNKDIKIMIELQRYWGHILEEQSNIARHKKAIDLWQQELSVLEQDCHKLEQEIKDLKLIIKNSETDLAETENQITKHEKKRDLLKTEKELVALEHELESANKIKEELEEKLIVTLDQLEAKETEAEEKKNNLEVKKKQVASDKDLLTKKIQAAQDTIASQQKKFDELVVHLSAAHKGRFLKIIESRGCKAVGAIIGEVCGNCNFKIPFHLVDEAKEDDRVTVCSNCGGFIYLE